jgi:hypothetical protein
MFVREQALIVLPSHRPPGRRSFSAAHELGHFAFDHGTRVDQQTERQDFAAAEPEEFLADAFAGFLLMPRRALTASIARAGLTGMSLDPKSVFKMSCEFGVGYETILAHLHYSLRLLDRSPLEELLRAKPKTVRRELCPSGTGTNLVYVSKHWQGRPVDAAVGDDILLPATACVDGIDLEYAGPAPDHAEQYRAIRPGVGRVSCGSWSAFVRVQKANYVGRAVYRHLKDPDE